MRVVCSPNPNTIDPTEGVSFSLLNSTGIPGVGRVGANLPSAVLRAGIKAEPKAWDFLAFALAVVAADHGCIRSKSADGWTREIELHVSVVDHSLWQQQATHLESALKFLTGDIWNITFHDGGTRPPRRQRRSRSSRPSGDVVCLLSGGVDSLVGAIDLIGNNKRPVLVSQVAKGDSDRQRQFARSIGRSLSHIQLSHAANPSGTAERSQRARSIMFLALGLLAATSLPEHRAGNSIDLVMPENGFISLNVPLTPLRVGSLSTRTAHPFFLSQIQTIWNVVGFNVQLNNPYQFKTKGEMLSECIDQQLLQNLVFQSTSCGRFRRYGYQHCGRCVPCLVRRAAFLHWDKPDQTQYNYDNLVSEKEFDDIRSVAMAALSVTRDRVQKWAGANISYAQLGNVDPYYDIASRGISELSTFLSHAGAM